MHNVKCYILNKNLKQLPIGAIGELYVGGVGIARGYVNRQILTKKRFIKNPFQTELDKFSGSNDLIYKTGDLAKFLPNGEIEFMGRADFQIKINGIRIEPGEIESKVIEHPEVKQCIVIAYDKMENEKILVCYFVKEKNSMVDEKQLIEYLRDKLIYAMIPNRLIELPQLPLNVNGKIDRNLLPEISTIINEEYISTDEITENNQNRKSKKLPNLEIVTTLKHIWSDILEIHSSKIKIDDSFFSLGGQSISCLLLITRIRRSFNCNLKISQIFELRTLISIATYIEESNCNKIIEKETLNIKNAKNEETNITSLHANGLHQGLMYHALSSQKSDDAYIVQSTYTYNSLIYPRFMKKAWEYILIKYPGLRLSFTWKKEPLQIINDEHLELNWFFKDISEIEDPTLQDLKIKELQLSDRQNPYKLDTAPLFRIYLIKLKHDKYSLIFSCHHIILDGWSLPLIHDEVHHIYICLTEGREFILGEDNSYIAAQNYWIEHSEDNLEYWNSQIMVLGERCDYSGLLNTNSRYKTNLLNYNRIINHQIKSLKINTKLVSQLKELCLANNFTLHSILQFAWHKVLNSIGGSQFTVVGTIVSGRNIPIEGIEYSVGLFINTLPLIVDHNIQDNHSIIKAICNIQNTVNVMNDKSIVEIGKLKNGTMKKELFDTLLVLENYPRLATTEVLEESHRKLKFDITYNADKVDYSLAVVAREVNNELVVNIWYAGELFNQSAIETLLDGLYVLLEQIAQDSTVLVKNMKLCSTKTIKLLSNWNSTDKNFTRTATLHSVFEEVVYRYRNSPAIIYEKIELTYDELNIKANQLANYLLSNVDLKPNDLLGLILDKSEKTIISILAVWKAGVAYTPIDPNFSDERISFMLDDIDAKLVLTNKVHLNRIENLVQSKCPIFSIEDIDFEVQFDKSPITPVTSNDLAYAIYTSGTTGKPKAVLVEHCGVVNLQLSLAKMFSLHKEQENEAFLSFSNYVFDHFIEQMTDALLNGQKLVVLNDDMRADHDRLIKYITENQVTYLSGTPSVLSLYNFSNAWTLTRIDLIGEDLTESVFNKIRESFKGVIINGYGPTEVSITTHKRSYKLNELRLDKSIGFPIFNIKCYVLNSSMQRVPIGGIGELYLGGAGVVRGYLNREDLTNERFLKNPFQTKDEYAANINNRIYKTGDLVRYLPNGELEYLGRTDLQVKIHGHRIELGEIESILASYPGISRSLVVVRENNDTISPQKFLVGYYIANENFNEAEIKRWMRNKLGEAFVPKRLIRIQNIPVNANGKLDTNQLPKIDFTNEKYTKYAAPTDSTEIELCKIWSKITSIDCKAISINDDFFAMGGDSIGAIILAQSIKNSFDVVFPVEAVFKYLTISEQAKTINDQLKRKDKEFKFSDNDDKTIFTEYHPASLAQYRLLFIDDFESGTPAYNITFCLEINNQSSNIIEKLKFALQILLRRHQALRTLLIKNDGEIFQYILDEESAIKKFHIKKSLVNGKTDLDEALVNMGNSVFHLDSELPINAKIFESKETPAKLYLNIVVHHCCFDGWSLNIFINELDILCGDFWEEKLTLPSSSYVDFAIWQRKEILFDKMSSSIQFWQKSFDNYIPTLLPLDFQRPIKFNYLAKEDNFIIDTATTKNLRELAKANKVSIYALLLSIYCLMLKIFCGSDDIVIGTPVANRKFSEFNNIIGFFANLIPIRIRIDSSSTLSEYIKLVGSTVNQVHSHSHVPYEEIIKCLNVENDSSKNPIAQNIFTLQNNQNLKTNKNLDFRFYQPNNNTTLTKFDTTTTINDLGDELHANFTYATSLFSDISIQQIIVCFKQIIQEFTKNYSYIDTVKVKDISTIDPDKYTELLKLHNNNTRKLATTNVKPLPQVFEEVVKQYSNLSAIIYEKIELTYDELNVKANQLAHYLLSHVKLKPNDLIGLVLDKSEKMIISILAVWKAGVAYTPIDPNYPDKRIRYMLEEVDAKLVLTNKIYQESLEYLIKNKFPVFSIENVNFEEYSDKPPSTSVTINDLAYAIYTSGTTGKPKAVLVDHQNIFSFVYNIQSKYFIKSTKQTRETILMLSNYAFDFSLEQIALSIFAGNKLLVPSIAMNLYDDDFYNFVNQCKLSYISGTPTQVDQFNLEKLNYLKYLIVGGEPFKKKQFDKIKYTYNGKLYVVYGTTETTVYNSIARITLHCENLKMIGNTLDNSFFYILDENNKLLPDNAIGELHIGGQCVSRGYNNQNHLTEKRYITNPYYSQQKNEDYKVIYKTGDLVRRRFDGTIEYIGRNDNQVKINGIRIELEEIENVLESFPGIIQCVVVPRVADKSDKLVLIAYYVKEKKINLNHTVIFEYLRQRLIWSMIPKHLICVKNSLPMTINGKIDIKALPKPLPLNNNSNSYQPPRNKLEYKICNLWGEQLEKDLVGIKDNFFNLGGDSIKAMTLTSRLQKELNLPISVKFIFDFPTVELLVDNVVVKLISKQKNGHFDLPAIKKRINNTRSLLPIQEWFFSLPLKFQNHWNQTFAIRTPLLDEVKLNYALAKLVNYHNTFNLRFKIHKSSNKKIEQFYTQKPTDIKLYKLDIKNIEKSEIEKHLYYWQNQFNLESGPTWCVAYLTGFQDGSARIWFSLHHLICDSVSWGILARDLQVLYNGGSLDKISYISYIEWVLTTKNYLYDQQEKDFWRKQITKVLTQSFEDKDLLNTSNQTLHRAFSLSYGETQLLVKKCNFLNNVHIIDLLLTSFGYTLNALTQRKINYITLESHGRELIEGAAEVIDTIGWFTSMYPFPITLSSNIEDSIELNKNIRNSIPYNGIGYGLLRNSYGCQTSPLPKISFNYLGQMNKLADKGNTKLWQLDSNYCGSSKSEKDIQVNQFHADVTIMLTNGELKVFIESRLHSSITDIIAIQFKNYLKKIIMDVPNIRTKTSQKKINSRVITEISKYYEPYILVNENNNKPLLFVFPPGEGGAESYLNNLAKYLPLKLVLFNNIHLLNPMNSFDKLAEYYVNYIKNIDPNGPYNLLGWSFGGVLALEVAIQLTNKKYQVNNLFIIDSYFDVYGATKEINLPGIDNILDSINYYYKPKPESIKKLIKIIQNLFIFKAEKQNDVFKNYNQEKLFEYYHKSQFNNLDRIIPKHFIHLEKLQNETHHSWVFNKKLVKLICKKILEKVNKTYKLENNL